MISPNVWNLRNKTSKQRGKRQKQNKTRNGLSTLENTLLGVVGGGEIGDGDEGVHLW